MREHKPGCCHGLKTSITGIETAFGRHHSSAAERNIYIGLLVYTPVREGQHTIHSRTFLIQATCSTEGHCLFWLIVLCHEVDPVHS